jgi:hypothetical protein
MATMKRYESFSKYLIPRLRDILFISIFMGLILIGPKTLNIDGDLGRHLTIGNYILVTRSIPTKDIFSHTMAGQPLTPHEWLAQVIFAASNRILGLDGIVLIEATIIAVTFTMVYLDTLNRGKSFLIAAGLTFWGAAASSLHWVARPHIFTFLFLVLWTPGVRRVARGETNALWGLPLLMLIWANSHGAFLAGFVVWGCYICGWIFDYYTEIEKPSVRIFKNLVTIGALSFLATLINPAGWHLWTTSLGYLQNTYLISHTQEYFSPDFHVAGTIPFLVIVFFSIFILSRGWKKLPTSEGLLLAGWTTMGLYSARNIPLFAIVATPILAWYLQSFTTKIKSIGQVDHFIDVIDTQLKGILWPMAFMVIIALLYIMGKPLDIQKQGNKFDPTIFPVNAVNWLTENPQKGRVFNYFPWGGYLLYRQWPDQLVFIDGQTDFYGEKLTRDYENVLTLRDGWREILTRYEADWVIIPMDSKLAIELDTDPGWSTVYQDELTFISARNYH